MDLVLVESIDQVLKEALTPARPRAGGRVASPAAAAAPVVARSNGASKSGAGKSVSGKSGSGKLGAGKSGAGKSGAAKSGTGTRARATRRPVKTSRRS
jgi:uncharacterized low-complexity protein